MADERGGQRAAVRMTSTAENKVWQNAPGRKEYRRGVRSAE
ncbi:hypothetical protein [Porcincola intestinalis]|nr:hypothetical protein [Porcincola intestinalis]MDY4205241.1 hypothetical protein [Porcincola intestinalis]